MISDIIKQGQEFVHWGSGLFQQITTSLSEGDPAMKGAITLVLAGFVGYMIRTVLIRYPQMILKGIVKGTKAWVKKKFVVRLRLVDDGTYNSVNFKNFMKFHETHGSKYGSKSYRLMYYWSDSRVAPGPGIHYFWFKGRFYWFSIGNLDSQGSEKEKSEAVIYTFGFTIDAMATLINAFKEKAPEGLLIMDCNGMRSDPWVQSNYMIPIKFDELVLDAEMLKTIKEKIDWFQNNEPWYRARNLDYKLNIMLWGPPGTGKSVLARAIASYMEYNLCQLPLASMHDTEFRTAMATVPKKSICLMEDFDDCSSLHSREYADAQEAERAEEQRKRKEEGKEEKKEPTKNRVGLGPSLSLFLNVMQGVNSSNGQVNLMTTNHKEKLDPAVYRPDRIDLEMYVGLMSNELIHRYIAKMYSPEDAQMYVSYHFPDTEASKLSQLFKTHPFNVHGFVKDLKKYHGTIDIEAEAVLKAA